MLSEKGTAFMALVGGLMAIALPVHSQQRTQTPDPQSPLVRFVIVPPAAQPLQITDVRDLAISPDGTHLVYNAVLNSVARARTCDQRRMRRLDWSGDCLKDLNNDPRTTFRDVQAVLDDAINHLAAQLHGK